MSEIIEDMGGGYAIMPRVIRKHRALSDGAKLMYVAIVDYAFNNLYCFPSVETLAADMGQSISSVMRQTRELREFGLVKVYQKTRESNYYIIMPLREVPNLTSDIAVEVPREEQYVSKEQFEALVDRNKRFYQSLNIVTDEGVRKPPKRSKVTSWDTKVAAYREKAAQGEYDALKANDLCVAFALKYEEKYGERYAVNWRTDSTAIKLALMDAGITGEAAIEVMGQFIEVYDRLFKSADYPRPRIAHLKVDWIMRKLMRHIQGMVAVEEQRQAADNIEIVGEF